MFFNAIYMYNRCRRFTLRNIAYAIYRDFFRFKKKRRKFIGKTLISYIFAQNIDLTRTHNLCFVSKLRKIGIPQFCYIKLGFKGVYITQTCFSDERKARSVTARFGIIENI